MEDAFLRDNYLKMPTKRMSKLLGRTDGTARQRLRILGLKVPAHIVQKFKQQTWFKKGQKPMNFGQKMSKETYNKVKHTMFKKGQKPGNYKPVGWQRVTVDGYREMKVAEPGKFEAMHRIMWEETFGPIPKDMIVRFVTKDKMNIDPWNLELVSRATNMKKNSIHNYGPEIAKAYQLLGAISRQINNKSK